MWWEDIFKLLKEAGGSYAEKLPEQHAPKWLYNALTFIDRKFRGFMHAYDVKF